MKGWWEGEPAERYWLETTDRADLGIDLNAPQVAETGKEYWGYSLIKEVKAGDVIVHYFKPSRAITGWSRAVGPCYEDEVFWGAHGMSARGMGVTPYYRPGWRLGLEGPFPLAQPITLDWLRGQEDVIRASRDAITTLESGPPYFPFELSAKRPPRPTQAYLTKLPASLIVAIAERFPTAGLPVVAAATFGRATPSTPAAQHPPASYRQAQEDAATSLRQPFHVDPNVVDRGLRGHAQTQNALARHISDLGLTPLSPAPDQPQFDLAWHGEDGVLRVAEVKSLTASNEERQLRLALGQVLRYAHLLNQSGESTRPIVVPERAPSDDSWLALCDSLGVEVAWPGRWDRLS
jgi:hypothetical protein